MNKKTLPKLLQEARELNIPSLNCIKTMQDLEKSIKDTISSIKGSSLEMIPLYVENALINLKNKN